VAFTAPVPRPPHRSWRCDDHWTTFSRRPGSQPVLHRFSSTREGRLSSISFARRSHRRSHADDRASLDSRSLLPPPFFGCCVRAYLEPGYCLPTSATEPRRTDTELGTPVSSLGRWPRPPSCSYASRRPLQAHGCPRTRKAVTRGEPRSRPSTSIPVPVRSHLHGFARPRYRSRRATPHGCSLRRLRESSVTIDVHGSLDRAKDVSPFVEALVRRLPRRVRALSAR